MTTTFHMPAPIGDVEIPLGQTRVTQVDSIPVECVGCDALGLPIWEALADGPPFGWSDAEPFWAKGSWLRLAEADLVPLVTVNWALVGA